MEVERDSFRRRGAISSPSPSARHSYASDSTDKGKSREPDESDTCRICRAEGTAEEPLFYPCRCSGSIKFVHQACLVEWLSHSQKKHCELCKTPFRFTKLYDPNMPSELPAPLFIRQALLHTFRSALTFLRILLVVFVWLGWLPWSMRAIWRALFWLADGRWSGSELPRAQSIGVSPTAVNVTTPVASTLASVSSAAEQTADVLPTDLGFKRQLFSSMLSFAAGEPLMPTLIANALSAVLVPAMSSTAAISNSSTPNFTSNPPRQRRPSWLSDVKFISSLTPYPTINNILIDTLEGQLITLLVVISFILVFLIREWVVQQQPLANAGDAEREAVVQLIANNPPERQREPRQGHEEQRDQITAEEPHQNPETGEPADYQSNVDEEVLSVNVRDVEQKLPSLAGDLEQSNPRVELQSGEASAFAPLDSDLAPDKFSSGAAQSRSESDDKVFKALWLRDNGEAEQVLPNIGDGHKGDLGSEKSATTGQENDSPPQHCIPRNSIMDVGSVGDHAAGPSNQLSSSVDSSHERAMDHERNALAIFNGRVSQAAVSTSNTDPVDNHSTEEVNPTDRIQHQNFTFSFPVSDNDALDMEEVAGTPAIAHIDHHPRHSAPEGRSDTSQVSAESGSPGSPTFSPASSTVRPQQTWAEKLFDWFWGDIPGRTQTEPASNQAIEFPIEVPALDEPFVQADDHEIDDNALQQIPAIPLALPDAGVDANDADAVEDLDDIEGILELIGMQGPIFGLLQNGVFSAVLVSFAVVAGIWLPYLWGKITLVLLENPIQLFFGLPITVVSIVADMTVDLIIGTFGYALYCASFIFKLVFSPLSPLIPLPHWALGGYSVTNMSLSVIEASSHRLGKMFNVLFMFHDSDIPTFSVLSHRALKLHEARVVSLVRSAITAGKFLVHDLPLRTLTLGPQDAFSFCQEQIDVKEAVLRSLVIFRSFLASLNNSTISSVSMANWVTTEATGEDSTQLLDYDLAVWGTKDRIIAIVMGYLLASFLGLLYIRVTGLFSADRDERVDGLVAEVLRQAGGILKVILIIGIEMIVFPLYCGTLLDVALLPLFQNATIASRVQFTSSSPLTSLFVHWFIGTCYMFHFALFVSMCRKIMRSGVLYFIRDPDDPTFHPVRDVLERNIGTQLRKIAFSALVYGALVIVCLGGVVWGLYFAFDDVLPVHWSSAIPVLEFPVDLLFYNFIMPLAIRSLKPSDVLHDLYNWWFHKCARLLRLTNFFFGERRQDEEGHHVRRSLWAFLTGRTGDTANPVIGDEQRALAERQNQEVYFVSDGRFVRAPASDQVRIPKGSQVFLEVSEGNERIDEAAHLDDGLHGRMNDTFTKVYIPPFFQLRIAAFIFLIWVFAATTGVGVTLVPLVVGRKIITSSFRTSQPVNDLYAMSIGLCIIGSIAYLFYSCRLGLRAAKDRLRPYLRSPSEAIAGLRDAALHAARLFYLFTAVSVLLPLIFALLTELYLFVPIHTYLSGGQAHVIHFIQDWTLGFLYVQMAIKFILWNSTSRLSLAINAVTQGGSLNPDVRLATRAFILPITLMASVAVILPLCCASVATSTIFRSSSTEFQSHVYRYSYPVTLLAALTYWALYLVRRQLHMWSVSIRDEVYLIGECLHNFSEKRAKDVGVSRRVITG